MALGTSESTNFLTKDELPWESLAPASDHTWLIPEHSHEYEAFPSITDFFDLRTLGVGTNRDGVVYDWDREELESGVKKFITAYNTEVHHHKVAEDAGWPDHVKWSEALKLNVKRGNLATFEDRKIVQSLYRPFAKQWLFFDRILNERVYRWPGLSGRCLAVTEFTSEKPFMVLVTDIIADKHIVGAGASSQCFPLSHLNDSAVAQFRLRYSQNSIAKEDVFHYIYALLHHPQYRERYAANLKCELPRIPFAPDFAAFAGAGKELARLHVDYESLKPWPLEFIENKDVPYSTRVTKMKLSADKQSLAVNESLTLGGIPPEAFEYRLGSRSALEWIIDQYQVKGESDPNREDDRTTSCS